MITKEKVKLDSMRECSGCSSFFNVGYIVNRDENNVFSSLFYCDDCCEARFPSPETEASPAPETQPAHPVRHEVHTVRRVRRRHNIFSRLVRAINSFVRLASNLCVILSTLIITLCIFAGEPEYRSDIPSPNIRCSINLSEEAIERFNAVIERFKDVIT